MNACTPSRGRGASRRAGKRKPSDIPCFSSDGRRLRNYSLTAIERCLALDPPSVIVKRNKRTGKITSATFRPLPGKSHACGGKEPLRKTAHMGQHYSFPGQVDDAGHKVWKFADFLVPLTVRESPEKDAVERYLQQIFRAVALSCLPE